MSRPPCPVPTCDRPAASGLMCGACQAELARALDAVPEVVRELETTLSRQTSRTTSGGRSSETALPYDARASEVLYVLRSALVGWVRQLQEAQPEQWPADTAPDTAAWLSEHLQRLVRHPAAEEAHGEIVTAVRAAERVVDRPAERQFAGRCPGCGAELYAKAGAAMAQCREQQCDAGAVKVSDQKAVMLDRLADHLATASQAADILTRLVAPLSAELVRQWIKRRKFLPHGSDASGRPLYRVADVAKELGDKLKRDAENQAKRDARQAVTAAS